MVLSDASIRELGSKLIEPFDPERVQPASYDLTLGDEVLVPRKPPFVFRDVVDPQTFSSGLLERIKLPAGDVCVLGPGECILGSTAEILRIPNDIVARVEGKSSLGRMFLAVHVTAGYIDPGWVGNITLEIVNHGPWRVLLRPGMRIAQVNFAQLDKPCEKPYGSPGLGSHYQGQRGPHGVVG